MRQLLMIMCFLCSHVMAQPVDTEISEVLNRFLAGASVNAAAVHDAFWHQDLVYTSSSGTRFGKEALMKGVKQAGEIRIDDLVTIYRAEQVNIREINDLVLLDFTLVAENRQDNSKQYYLNSGVFTKVDNTWQAINWHATLKGTTE